MVHFAGRLQGHLVVLSIGYEASGVPERSGSKRGAGERMGETPELALALIKQRLSRDAAVGSS
jgi:hypothetical protein